MSGVALSAPILPGKADEWKNWSRELAEEPRRSDYIAVMKKNGVTRIRVWLQEGWAGPVAIILYEGETPTGFFQEIATSQDPFAVWFRERVKDIHGFDMTEAKGPPSELINDFHSD